MDADALAGTQQPSVLDCEKGTGAVCKQCGCGGILIVVVMATDELAKEHVETISGNASIIAPPTLTINMVDSSCANHG